MGKTTNAGAARRKTGSATKKKAKTVAKAEPATFDIVELDPLKKCGPGTSVQQLYRVSERADKANRTHLVFYDKHGWYCEHGQDCPAVAHARRAAKQGTKAGTKAGTKQVAKPNAKRNAK